MHDIIPALAPEPNITFPFVSLGITERLRRPILDHMLLGTRQAYIVGILGPMETHHLHISLKERQKKQHKLAFQNFKTEEIEELKLLISSENSTL